MNRLHTSECGINSVATKALDGMRLEVGGGCSILQILVATNTFPCDFPFALLGGTLEKMVLLAILISNSDIGLKKAINGGAPSGFEAF
jgi:hypothetical protein